MAKLAQDRWVKFQEQKADLDRVRQDRERLATDLDLAHHRLGKLEADNQELSRQLADANQEV